MLLTSHDLLTDRYVPKEIHCEKTLTLILDAAQDIAGMYALAGKYLEAQEGAFASVEGQVRRDRSVVVPAIGNVAARCKEFMQRSDLALRKLFNVVKLFYPDVGKGGWEGFRSKIEKGPSDLNNFPQFLNQSLSLLQLVRNGRNCVEHPRPEQRMIVTDFSTDPKNHLIPPTISIIHPKTSLPTTSVADFFGQVAQSVVSIVELMIVFLCARQVQPVAGVSVRVVEIPADRRGVNSVRYGYGANIGGEIVPMS